MKRKWCNILKTCSKCGKLHDFNYVCKVGRTKKNYKYTYEESKLRNTHNWHKKAEEIKQASNYLCSVCFDKGIYNYNNLEVHHIEKLRDRPERLLDNYNLICLCREHHKQADAEIIDKKYLIELAKKREDSQDMV